MSSSSCAADTRTRSSDRRPDADYAVRPRQDAASLSSHSGSPRSASPLSHEQTPALERGGLRGLQSPEAQAAFECVAIERQSPGALFDEEVAVDGLQGERTDAEVAAPLSPSVAVLAAIESPLPLPTPSLQPSDVQAVLISGTNVVRRALQPLEPVGSAHAHCREK